MSESQKLPTTDQIEAAKKLYEHKATEYWQREDKILTGLRNQAPSLTDPQQTLIKVTLVNSFYNAGCPDIEEMTKWIVDQRPELPEVYRNIDATDDIGRINLIRSIVLRGRTTETSQLGGYVFASKFAHFFLDAEAFPIYDQYARLLVHFHIDELDEEKQLDSKDEKPYWRFFQFYKKFFRLKQQLEHYSTKTLDCYLWSAGQYVACKKGIDRTFYIHSRLPFDAPDNQSLYETLFPQARIEDVPDDLLLSELDWSSGKQKDKWKKRREEKSNGSQT